MLHVETLELGVEYYWANVCACRPLIHILC